MKKAKIHRYVCCLIVAVLLIYFNLLKATPDTFMLDYAAQHDIENGILIGVDFSKKSCENRLYVYDMDTKEMLYACKVLNGRGGNNRFSNEVGSNCSSLGLYRLCFTDILSNGYPCIRLRGLESTNSNAAKRGIVIHPSKLASALIGQWPVNAPLTNASLGCFAVSYSSFHKICELTKSKRAYLYAFH